MTTAMSTTNETAILAPQTWQLDPAHTLVEFSVKHLMITTVKGRFRDVAGSVTIDESNPSASAADITIDVGSIDTAEARRDAHLRSADFFDAENHPKLRFVATRVEGDIASDFTLVGDLTIRGKTREITLRAKNGGRATDPWGNEKVAFSATGKLNRQDYGLKWNAVLETGGVTVGNEVKIHIEAQLVRQG
jgi:polyisoprenoid-binding protein YceI